MLKKLVFRAGINKEGTQYSAEGGWYDGSNVRFRKGRPEKIGGWQKLSNNAYLGVCRKLHNWSSYNGDDYMGLVPTTFQNQNQKQMWNWAVAITILLPFVTRVSEGLSR